MTVPRPDGDHASDQSEVDSDTSQYVTLAIVVVGVLVIAIDMMTLNVVVPSIVRDFDTSLSSVQWIVSGYSLTFASLLIVGGRLGDIYGARWSFVVGALLFGVGAFVASVAPSLVVLVLGKAVIQAAGAALMLPATLAILSTTFQGARRATAFAVWGATSGFGVAFGPVVGGALTAHLSWRWALRLSVLLAAIVLLGAFAVVRPAGRGGTHRRLDLLGAASIAASMFLLVFGLSQGARLGWLMPIRDLAVAGRRVWPVTAPISATPCVFAMSAVLLVVFVTIEHRVERMGGEPVIDLELLRHPGVRYGLLSAVLLSLGQHAAIFGLTLFLQQELGLGPSDCGLWMVPSGVMCMVGAHISSRVTRQLGAAPVVRIGLACQAVGLVVLAMTLSPTTQFVSLLPSYVLLGIGIGFAGSQLTNVILADVQRRDAGSASGATSTARQIGAALGIATTTGALGTGDDVTVGIRMALLIAAVLTAVSGVLALLIPRRMPARPGRAELASSLDGGGM